MKFKKIDSDYAGLRTELAVALSQYGISSVSRGCQQRETLSKFGLDHPNHLEN